MITRSIFLGLLATAGQAISEPAGDVACGEYFSGDCTSCHHLSGASIFPLRFANSSWSPVETDDGVKVAAAFEATKVKIVQVKGFVSAVGATTDVRTATYQDSVVWYDSISADMFG